MIKKKFHIFVSKCYKKKAVVRSNKVKQTYVKPTNECMIAWVLKGMAHMMN